MEMARINALALTLMTLVIMAMGVSSLVDLPLHARGGSVWKNIQAQRSLAASEYDDANENGMVEERVIVLPCDHFNTSDTTTYKNRYFIQKSSQQRAPIFFLMGGESPVTGIGRNFFSTLGNKYKAHLVAIEHRFYGESMPYGSLKTQNLRVLNVEQALADVVALINALQQELAPNQPPLPVINWGGSYSGGLSAWLRVAYPNVTTGALSSSGVVNAILNYTAFDETISAAIGDDCGARVRHVNRAIEAALERGEGDRIKKMMGASVLNDLDFFFMVADGEATAVQYGSKRSLCSALSKPFPDDEAYIAAFAAWLKDAWGADFASQCYYDTQCLKSQESRWDFARAWRWQCCDQLAYFQIAPAVNSIRSTTQTLQYMLDQCVEIFGEGVVPRTEEFNRKFGGAYPPTTNVFFSDFSDDPWQTASVNTTLSPSLPYEYVKCDGCGHCMDFHLPSSLDPVPLTNERARFDQYTAKWLSS